jgi:hypothetical protein
VIEGDGVNYFVYLHPVVFDHDLDLGHEFRGAQEAGVPVFPGTVGALAPTGFAADFQPVGPALLSLPLPATGLLLPSLRRAVWALA